MNPMKYYVDAAGNYLGGWDANSPDGAVEVPFPPENAKQKWDGEDWYPYIPTQPPVSLQTIASAKLTVIDGEVAGFERSVGVIGGFIADVDTAWIYFEEQPDTDYIIQPREDFTKYTDHVEITRAGLSELSFVIQRVQ